MVHTNITQFNRSKVASLNEELRDNNKEEVIIALANAKLYSKGRNTRINNLIEEVEKEKNKNTEHNNTITEQKITMDKHTNITKLEDKIKSIENVVATQNRTIERYIIIITLFAAFIILLTAVIFCKILISFSTHCHVDHLYHSYLSLIFYIFLFG